MQVILLERVSKLGQMGDVVDVKPGYARNFLLPQGKAQTASETNIAAFEKQKSQLEAQNLETKKEADALLGKLDGQTFIVIRSASDSELFMGRFLQEMQRKLLLLQGFLLTVSKFLWLSLSRSLGCMKCLLFYTQK